MRIWIIIKIVNEIYLYYDDNGDNDDDDDDNNNYDVGDYAVDDVEFYDDHVDDDLKRILVII